MRPLGAPLLAVSAVVVLVREEDEFEGLPPPPPSVANRAATGWETAWHSVCKRPSLCPVCRCAQRRGSGRREKDGRGRGGEGERGGEGGGLRIVYASMRLNSEPFFGSELRRA